MNPDFQKIGESFVSYYYNIFDQRETRENILACYHAEALLTFEEEQCQGIQTIRQKLCEKFKMGSIHRVITKIDCQPMYDGGVLVYVFGQLAEKEAQSMDKPMGFSHTFVLRSTGDGSFCIANEIFRLTIYNFAA
ncbi:putative nuclear transport factor 2 isoform X2 [Babylonia areolata]|uniref:putative nuclear transport factor 2 isoform X2 n=1 Tax=Babylonia areolata TaxID=304850 RepID=UPI003FD2CAC0